MHTVIYLEVLDTGPGTEHDIIQSRLFPSSKKHQSFLNAPNV